MRAKYIETVKRAKELEDWESGPEMLAAHRALDRSRRTLDRQKRKLEQTAFLLESGVIPASEHEAALEQYESLKDRAPDDGGEARGGAGTGRRCGQGGVEAGIADGGGAAPRVGGLRWSCLLCGRRYRASSRNRLRTAWASRDNRMGAGFP